MGTEGEGREGEKEEREGSPRDHRSRGRKVTSGCHAHPHYHPHLSCSPVTPAPFHAPFKWCVTPSAPSRPALPRPSSHPLIPFNHSISSCPLSSPMSRLIHPCPAPLPSHLVLFLLFPAYLVPLNPSSPRPVSSCPVSPFSWLPFPV